MDSSNNPNSQNPAQPNASPNPWDTPTQVPTNPSSNLNQTIPTPQVQPALTLPQSALLTDTGSISPNPLPNDPTVQSPWSTAAPVSDPTQPSTSIQNGTPTTDTPTAPPVPDKLSWGIPTPLNSTAPTAPVDQTQANPWEAMNASSVPTVTNPPPESSMPSTTADLENYGLATPSTPSPSSAPIQQLDPNFLQAPVQTTPDPIIQPVTPPVQATPAPMSVSDSTWGTTNQIQPDNAPQPIPSSAQTNQIDIQSQVISDQPVVASTDPNTSSFPTSNDNSAPTDLSQLIATSPPPQAANPTPSPEAETIVVTPGSVPDVPTPTAQDKKGIPVWLIGFGFGLLILVMAGSAYFILGIGKSTQPTTSIPAEVTDQPQTITPVDTANPTPTEPPVATNSGNLNSLTGSGTGNTASASAAPKSAAQLLEQKLRGN